MYDFATLSPYDFEVLCRDLLQAEFGVTLQSFTTGPDGGIDLRYARTPNKQLVVQCKHYARSTFSKLMSHLRKEELPKVKKLSPARYVLATSLGLTPDNVDDIYGLFAPFCQSPDDVFGRDALNNLLRKNPEVEKRNFKLWLTSQVVLERVVHSAVFAQSELDRHEIERKMRLYVENRAVDRAREILDSTHCCIITGILGIGKTTLAQILLVDHLMSDWEVIAINENIEEAFQVYKSDLNVKQVFYYDDFLGQIALGDTLGKNEDRSILRLIAAVRRVPTRRLILTTREYILAQARERSEVLARADLCLDTCVLELEDYDDVEKAKILANHLYFSGAPSDHIAALLIGRRYRRLVQHENYNPRLVEWMTDYARFRDLSAEEYFDAFLRLLDHPARLWEHAFANQIRESSRHLLLALASCGPEVMLDDLKKAFEPLYRYRAQKFRFSTGPQDFFKSLNELERTFIRIQKVRSGTVVSFHNPSVVDFLAGYLSENAGDLDDLLRCAVHFEQLERVVALAGRTTDGEDGACDLQRHSDALCRCIRRIVKAPSIRVTRHRSASKKADYYNHPLQMCSRLAFAIRTAGSLNSPDFRQIVLRFVTATMAELREAKPWFSSFVSMIRAIEEADWVDAGRKADWLRGAKDYLMCAPTAFDEAQAAIDWSVDHWGLFGEEERRLFTESMTRFVSREAQEVGSQITDSAEMNQLVQDVEDVGEKLGVDFDSEVHGLEERRDELALREDMIQEGYSDEGWHGRHDSAHSAGEIDRVFEALADI